MELKYLAGYLPYKLRIKFISDYDIDRLSDENIVELKTIDEGSICVNGYRTNNKSYLPILHPLLEYEKFNEIVLEMTNYETDMIDKNPDMVGRLAYDVIELMFKNHIDIYGLIPQKLAIDINTL